MSDMQGANPGAAGQDANAGQTQPGWYPDPNTGQLRWWDGSQWGQFQEGAPPAVQPVAGQQDPKQMAMIAHLLGIILGFIGPLIIMLTSGAKDPFIKDQSTEALNFQITVTIAYFVCGLLVIVLVGLVLLPIVWIGSIALSVIGGMAANRGEWYRYPFALRLVK